MASTSSTTPKLPPALKKRIAPLARQSGKSPHAWMVEAIEREAARAELRQEFVQDALDAAAAVDAGGPLYAAEDVHAWLRAKVRGEPAPKPRALPRRRGR